MNGNSNEYSTMYLLSILESFGDITSASHRKSWKFTVVSMSFEDTINILIKNFL